MKYRLSSEKTAKQLFHRDGGEPGLVWESPGSHHHSLLIDGAHEIRPEVLLILLR